MLNAALGLPVGGREVAIREFEDTTDSEVDWSIPGLRDTSGFPLA